MISQDQDGKPSVEWPRYTKCHVGKARDNGSIALAYAYRYLVSNTFNVETIDFKFFSKYTMSLRYLNCTATAWYSDFTVCSCVIPFPIIFF